MESEGNTYLIYDKAADKDHAFNNPLTKNITIETIFSSDYPFYEGIEAINEFNTCFKNNSIDIIPDDINLDMYNVYLFYYKLNGVAIKITLLSVNNKKLAKCVKNKNIPSKEFLILSCRSHILYSKATRGINIYDDSAVGKFIGKIEDTIIKSAKEPNADPTDPMEEQPEFIKCNLYPYQKRTIKWMLDREKESTEIYYNINEGVSLGEVVYDSADQDFTSANNRNKLVFKGGALIDEVGLGKTIQELTKDLLNPAVDTSYIQERCTKIFSKATLVICPNHLCLQWIAEIKKMVNKTHNVKIIPLFTKIQHEKYTYQDLLDADFVVVSYNFFSNQSFLSQWLSSISNLKSYHKSPQYSHDIVSKIITKLSSELKKDLTFLEKNFPNILLIHFYRVVVDEFHELVTNQSYNFILRFLKLLSSDYNWILTGTPFDKDTSCLMNMIDFVTSYTNKFDEKKKQNILLDPNIAEYMTRKFFRRNTKKSVEAEYQLPPLKETVVWLDFSKPEWMIYNAYIANPNIDKFGVLLRQICCHPKIAEELKGALSNCKTLDEMEGIMVKHYKTVAQNALYKIKYAEYKIYRVHMRIKFIEWKRQRKFLRQLGYRVKFKQPQEKYTKEEIDFLKKHTIDEVDVDQYGNGDGIFDNIEDYNESSNSDDDDKKPLFTISDDNQKEIIKLVGKYMDNDIPQSIIQLNTSLENYEAKLAALNKDYDGKKATYDYFDGVMKKIKVATVKTQKDDSSSDSDSDDEDREDCSVCLSEICGHNLGVTKCGHIFHFDCVKPFIEKNGKCPLCQKVTKSEDIYIIKQELKEEPDKETLDKQLLVNKVGTKLANLIFFLKKTGKHTIIFSQWDELLIKVGDVLDEHGIKNVFCRGHVWQRDKAIRDFYNDDSIKVIMLSSKSAASGTNLTKATMVVLLDPVSGSYEYRKNTEWQAIGRAYRMGQQSQVEVVRLVIKGTVEEDIYALNMKEDMKVPTDKVTFSVRAETTGDDIDLDKAAIDEMKNAIKVRKPRKATKATTVGHAVELKEQHKQQEIPEEQWEEDWVSD